MKSALISVWDKTGVVELAAVVARCGYRLISSGGTAAALREAGLEVTEVADYTGFPEMMGGRVKTLHPRVHGGILARRDLAEDREAMAASGIDSIDLVVVNLYPFRATVRRPGATREQIVENIDIGGPAMVRSAAKNHAFVAVVVDPADYAEVGDALTEHRGELPAGLRRRLAAKAFAHTAAYDLAIAAWMGAEDDDGVAGRFWGTACPRLSRLRYGENPHQRAALYAQDEDAGPSLARARQLHGKELSYNNLLDLDAALATVLDLPAVACAIVKHNNPCGAAAAETQEEAFALALEGDPVSAFGGIVAFNQPLDVATARRMAADAVFFEAVVAPAVEPAALAALQAAKWGGNVRVLELGGRPQPPPWVARQISGGWLVQDPDRPPATGTRTVTARAPTAGESAALELAWAVCRHVKSNAIVLARQVEGACAVVGVGAGQMSRVDAARIAVEKAGERARGAVVASDAFFPFADGLEVALQAGVTAAIQPGGSKRDQEVIAAADARGAAMVMTGVRHFRH